MNLPVSYDWIKEYVRLNESAEDFARRLSLSGPGVERLYPQAPAFDKIAVGVILEVKAHPNADKLRIATVDLGREKREIVCGGSNLEKGMKVAVALTGAKVRWHGEGELIELKSAEIRGVKSDGMICAASEIGLADAFPHAEREILDLSWCKAAAGTPLSEALGLDDAVFDIEVTTNRPDAFSVVGLAREAAAIFDRPFLWKEPLLPSVKKGAASPVKVKNLAPKLCTRYQAVAVEGVSVGPSPWWLKKRLRMSGIRTINNVVDITNYVLLEYGQPLHAFDLATLKGGQIIVRQAKTGEKLLALDGKTYALTEGQLVIADAERPVAIAGVMGGEETGAREGTTAIVFESATFDPVSVRRAARSLALHSDSSLRFEKGLPEEQTASALARAVELCQQVAGGRVAGPAVDVRSTKPRKVTFPFRPEKARRLIGVDIPEKTMVGILSRLGFGVAKRGKKYAVTVPYWRARDIESERDLVEEVARVYGYANLPGVCPTGELPRAERDPLLIEEDRVRDALKAAGFTELLTYSFVSGEALVKCGFDPSASLRVANPLSSDFEYMRPGLLPGVLMAIAQNQGLFPEGRVFEVSHVYEKSAKGLPVESSRGLAVAYGTAADDSLFRAVKGVLEACYPAARSAKFERATDSPRWHPGRSATIESRVVEWSSGPVIEIGLIGEVHPAVLKRFGIEGRVAMFDLDVALAMRTLSAKMRYSPVPQFPPVKRDLAFVVDESVEYAAVSEAVTGASVMLSEIELFDVFRGGALGKDKKSMAFHLAWSSSERTLTVEEVDKEFSAVVSTLEKKFGAKVRS